MNFYILQIESRSMVLYNKKAVNKITNGFYKNYLKHPIASLDFVVHAKQD